MDKLMDCELEHVTPEKVGVKSSAVEAFINEINNLKLGVHSFTFVRHDKVFAQCFWEPYSSEYPHVLYSMSKSVTATAVGLCVGDGLIDIDEKVYKYFPEHKTHDIQNKMLTVRNLLTMRSDKLITVFENKGGTDWIKNYFSAPFLAPPNSRFNYISENTFMLSAIVSKVTGMSMLDYLNERMFKPLGIEKPYWECDGKGNNAGGWGLYMKSEDIAKFFLPYMHGGKYKDGTQLIPKEWVEAAVKKQTESVSDGFIDNMCGYGFQFWRNPYPNSYRCDGLFGQRCFFLPEYDAMCVLNCGHSKDYEVMKVFWKYFPEAFEYDELPQNDDAYKSLLTACKKCSVEQLECEKTNEARQRIISGRTMICKTSEFTSVLSISVTQMLFNKPGSINMMRLDFDSEVPSFTWREKLDENTVKIGMNGKYEVSRIKLGDLNLHAFTKGAWQSDGTFKLWIRPIETAHERRFTFKFNDDKTVKIINESYPRFDDLVVYNFVFQGLPIPANTTEDALKQLVNMLGLPFIEPNIKAKFIN